jgi:hypothetical protein
MSRDVTRNNNNQCHGPFSSQEQNHRIFFVLKSFFLFIIVLLGLILSIMNVIKAQACAYVVGNYKLNLNIGRTRKALFSGDFFNIPFLYSNKNQN